MALLGDVDSGYHFDAGLTVMSLGLAGSVGMVKAKMLVIQIASSLD